MTLNYIDKRRNIKIPNKDSKELAEFFGILTGDGYIGIYKNNHVIEIAGNKIKDKGYMENYVSNLFFILFNIKPNINFRISQNTMYLKLQSKSVLEYIKSKKFKQGVKGRIGIPIWIRNNEILMTHFVKGLFDTDGCISLKKKEGKFYPSLSITSQSDILLMEIKKFLISHGISLYFATRKYNNERYKTRFETYQIQVNGYKNIIMWFEKIGSNNPRNFNKFNEMIRLRSIKRL